MNSPQRRKGAKALLCRPTLSDFAALQLCAFAFVRLAANLFAAETPATSTNAAPVSPYNAPRSFAQPIRPDPISTNFSIHRAFWGAPPPMPHSFPRPQDDGRACLECHAREDRIEKRQQAIVPVPHAEYSQCQQCHVPSRGDLVELGEKLEQFRPTTFAGLDAPGKGTRAHAFAPPTIPHKTYMRDNCLSCHGPEGKQKIATPHPWRSQCQQCHVSDASKNYDRPLPWKELKGEL
jgi:nitrate reductase cytochrome c-type subunit